MLNDRISRKVAVVGYNRIPFSRNNASYATASNQDMMTATLNGLIDRYHLDGKLLGEVAGGAVIKHSKDLNLIRECVMATTLDPATPACDLQQACNTGIEAAIYIANKISLGQIECGIAGGVDSTSDVPLFLSENLRKILLSPVYATARMLEKAKLTLSDFDLYEIHEAFAAQVLALLKIWETPELIKQFGYDKPLGSIDMARLNVNGSSLAAGHPFAATGGRVIATMAKLLYERGSGRGFVSVCAAGGQGATLIMER